MDITSASFRLPALWLDGDLMHHPARPLRLENVAESLGCRGIRNASAPHRVQPWQWAARGSWRAAPGHQGCQSGVIKGATEDATTCMWASCDEVVAMVIVFSIHMQHGECTRSDSAPHVDPEKVHVDPDVVLNAMHVRAVMEAH
ncbi:hypothetical protein HaLaN_26597 [Haematococcus lacustris]|uniref:Uncharacterized protein n=1 Tax=Haematococcus lacustris TaxID=44745 RepID=A0A6A0A6J9_HAELA|nr:hypothetical protein HaLaN_26597 [Haematococcus lacustris]